MPLLCGVSYHLHGSQIHFEIQQSGSTSSQILHQQLAILANSDILASYVSRRNDMAYDTCPHK